MFVYIQDIYIYMHVNSNSILQVGCLPFLLPAVGFSSPYVSNLVNTQGVEWEFCSIPSENITNKPTSLIQHCINLIFQMHHFVTEMCTILFQNGALGDTGWCIVVFLWKVCGENYIAITSRGRNGVSKIGNCLFNSLFRPTSKETSKFFMTGPLSANHGRPPYF